jgi:hypothetical protein
MMHIILEIDVATLTLAMSSTGGTKSTISSLIHHTRDHRYEFSSCQVSADGLASQGACMLAPDSSMFF